MSIQGFGGETRGKRPLGRTRRRWDNNLERWELQEVGLRDMDWVELALGRHRWRALVVAVMDLRVT
jgi:hypothetical protein